ncbi:MAG: hypothetical protein CL871_03590 [Cytophagia bacterium]|nr:hypothetical protein [Cytophagia bacterium]
MKKFQLFFLILILIYSCDMNNKEIILSDAFDYGKIIGKIENNIIEEASGLVESVENSNSLWTHNDGGDGPFLYLISSFDAKILKKISLVGIKNEDWEDLAIGPSILGDTSTYIYLGDIGDNKKNKTIKKIHFFREPKIKNFDNELIEINDIKTISFYSEKKIENFETLMIDPNSKELFLIAKNKKKKQNIYKIDTENIEIDEIQKAKKYLTLNLKNLKGEITGGEISRNGQKCLIKTYKNVFLWERKKDEKWKNIWSQAPKILKYIPESQGEAICWSNDENAYFTLSENENSDQEQKLFKYLKN